METQVYQHRHIKGMTCIIISYTKRGAKVLQTEGGKTKQAFYDKIDFEDNARGLWIKSEDFMTLK